MFSYIKLVMKRKFNLMVNNSTNISKTNNHLSTQTLNKKQCHMIWCCFVSKNLFCYNS